MSFIEVKHIEKTFKVREKEQGKFAALKTFFSRKYKYINAVNDISFSIKKGEIIRKIPEDKLLEELRKELMNWNA